MDKTELDYFHLCGPLAPGFLCCFLMPVVLVIFEVILGATAPPLDRLVDLAAGFPESVPFGCKSKGERKTERTDGGDQQSLGSNPGW